MKHKLNKIIEEWIGEDRNLGKYESYVAVEINAHNRALQDLRNKIPQLTEKIVEAFVEDFGDYTDGCGCCSHSDVKTELLNNK